jgi:LPXTG-motif cell wall-anchored protein
MAADRLPLQRLPERHTDFRFSFHGPESASDVFALLAVVAAIGLAIWWFFLRRRR